MIGLTATGLGFAARATGQDKSTAPPDPIAALAAELGAGGPALAFSDAEKGYAPALLKRLKTPEDSQVLVFSKTSLQAGYISPETPRAIYFNDSVAIGTIPGAPLIEMWAVGKDGLVRFYTLKNTKAARPTIQPEDIGCMGCHEGVNPSRLGPLIESVTTLPSGIILNVDGNHFTDGRSPITDRWGGWYITGTTGTMTHRGNVTAVSVKEASLPPNAGQNMTSLTGRFNSTRYVRSTSDIVAIMTLEHQTGFLNLVGSVDALVAADAEPKVITDSIDTLADYMLGVDAAALTSPVKGVSGFAERFAAEGPKDAKGRTLRAFDLRTRLFRYPLSYMIYSPAFDTIPADAKMQLYRRLIDVLSGRDTSPKYAGLARTDCEAAFDILATTKSDLPAFWRRMP